MKQPHDKQIGWQVVTRKLDRLETVIADRGYDWDDLRHKSRDNGVCPLIKHEEFYHLDKAHNARMDDEVHHLRSTVESAFFAIKHRHDDRLRARSWFGQFRVLVLEVAIRKK